MRLRRIIGLLLLAAALASCSTVKFAYNALDDVALWWLDSYVDFTDEQEQRMRQDLRRLQRWHRAEELPQLAALLRRMEEIAPGPVTPEQVCSFWPSLRDRFQVIADRAEPAAIALLMDFEPAQIVHLERKYAKGNADFRKEWIQLDSSNLREKRTTQLLERAESLYGSLNDAQRQVVEQQAVRSVFDPRRTLAERQRRQQDALETIRKIAGRGVAPEETKALFRGYLQRAQVPPEAGPRAYQEAMLAESCRSVSALHNSTTAAQRERAVRRLRGWQRDLQELAAQ